MVAAPPGGEQDPLARIVVALVQHEVDFIAIGGWAVRAQRYDLGRVTYDVDVRRSAAACGDAGEGRRRRAPPRRRAVPPEDGRARGTDGLRQVARRRSSRGCALRPGCGPAPRAQRPPQGQRGRRRPVPRGTSGGPAASRRGLRQRRARPAERRPGGVLGPAAPQRFAATTGYTSRRCAALAARPALRTETRPARSTGRLPPTLSLLWSRHERADQSAQQMGAGWFNPAAFVDLCPASVEPLQSREVVASSNSPNICSRTKSPINSANPFPPLSLLQIFCSRTKAL